MKSFTSARPDGHVSPLADVGFELDGEVFRCLGELSILDLSDLARRVGGVTDPEDAAPEVQAAMVGSMSESLLMAMGQAEYDRFRGHCRKHHTPDDVIVAIMQEINEAVQSATEAAAARPTGQSATSSTGSADPDDRTQRVISLQTGDVRVIPPPKDHQQPKAQGAARGRVKETGGRRATG